MNGRYLVIDLVDGGPGHRTVVLQGDLDSSTAGEFDDRVSQGCPAWKGDAVVVDLSGLEYISSAGVRSLLRLERMLGAGTLHLEGATGIVRDVLETTGILQPEDPWSGGSEEEVPDRASMVEVADLKVVADPERIPEILDFIGDMASSYGLSQEDSPHLRLAMEEILTSVFSYGYGNNRIHSADVVIAVGDGVIRVSVRDKGLPYDYKTLLKSRSADSANILTHMRHGPLMMNLGKDGREQIVWFRLPEVTSEGPCSPGGLPPVDFDSITIHPMRPEEGIQVAQCLYDEFGYTYINDIVYYPDRFAEEVASKRMLSYTAVAPSGEVAGHLTLIKTSLLPGTAELAMGIVRKRYRKGSLMTRLTEAVMGAAGDDGLTSIYAQPVGFHPYTQRICISDGMMPCAVNINYAGSDMAMSYYTDRRRQHVFMAVKMLSDVRRTVHCPPDARDVVDFVISGCGLDRVFADPVEPMEGSLTSIDVELHESTASATVFVRRVGGDVDPVLRRANRSVKESRSEVAFIYINLQDPGASAAYDSATSLGYFVVGMFPGTSCNDWLIMHNTFIGGIDYGSFTAEGPFAELLDLVRAHDPEGCL